MTTTVPAGAPSFYLLENPVKPQQYRRPNAGEPLYKIKPRSYSETVDWKDVGLGVVGGVAGLVGIAASAPVAMVATGVGLVAGMLGAFRTYNKWRTGKIGSRRAMFEGVLNVVPGVGGFAKKAATRAVFGIMGHQKGVYDVLNGMVVEPTR